MLVEVERITGSPDAVAQVEVRTSVGRVTVRWCGDPVATLGAHHVEWELDEEFRWGLNCVRAEVAEPRLCQDERGVVLRGQLCLEGTGSAQAFAYVELADSMIALGHVDALPDGMSGAWVELHLEPEKVVLYPYVL